MIPQKIQVIFDMETADPDDALTLLSLCDHPRVDLKAVTITPGSRAQFRLVRYLLTLMNKGDVEVGVHDINWPKPCVSAWHYTALMPLDKDIGYPDPPKAWELLHRYGGVNVTLLTGASPRNLGTALLREPQLKLGRWVAQGGFAGANIVPEEKQLEKFKGLITCATYNFNGDPKAAMRALETPTIFEKRLVSKNVCHGISMTPELRTFMFSRASSRRPSIELLAKHTPNGKMLHDLTAMTAVVDQESFEWERVKMYRALGQWGANPDRKSDTWISVGLKLEALANALVEGA